jgi:hypothetical protein
MLEGNNMAKKNLKKGAWTKADLQLIKKMFANASTAAIAKKLGRPLEAVKKKASRMGLTKSKKYMKTLGRS